ELLSVTPQGSDLPQPLRISNMVSKFELSYHCAVERLASYIRFSPTSDKGLTPAVTSQMQPVIPNRRFNSGLRQGLFVLALALVTILAYRPAWNGGFLWDDDVYITNNELLTAPNGLRRIWFSLDSPSQYFPLTYTTFRIEQALWGLKPFGYHWTNIFLLVANALLIWRFLLQKKSIDRRRLSQIVPFLILGLSMGLLAVWWERYHQGTHGALFALTLPERILVASRAVCFYLSKLFWPSNLIFIYPKWTISAAHVLDYAWLVVGIAACVLISFTRRFFGRAVEVAAVFFVATLSPVLGFIMLYSFRYTFVADHYQYLACIGPIALVSAGIVTLADK